MKRLFIIIYLCGSTLLTFSQSATFTASYDSASFQDVIAEVESSLDLKFYYRLEWINGLTFSKKFENANVDEVLSSLLAETPITYLIQGEKVILANNVTIIDNPPISGYLDRQEEVQEVETGFVFAREYLAGQTDDASKGVYEIGSRNQFVQGSNVTVAGYIKEKEGGEPVEGAFIYVEEPFSSATSGADGFYSLTVPNGKRTLLIQSVNMKDTHRDVILLSDGKFDIDLQVDVIALNSVVVNADRDINIKSSELGITRLKAEDIKAVPVLLGEADIIKVATTTSGVQTVGEGSAGINIRGGKADQNLFLLDGTPVYNPSHFFGFFSVINSDVVEGMELYKSSIPAEYGGRLSSVFDIESKRLSKEKIKGKGGVGPVTSRFMLEGPTFNGGPSFMVGGRATYSSFIINQIQDSPLGNNDVSFYDLIGKLNYEIGDKDEISVLGYYSHDSFNLSSDTLLSFTNFTYENKVLSLNWKHTINDRMETFLNAGRSDYEYNIGYDQLASQAFNIGFGLKEDHVKAGLNYYQSDALALKAGLEYKDYLLKPGIKSALGTESLIAGDQVDEEQGNDFAGFLSGSYDPGGNFSLYGGLRYSVFNVLGPGTVYSYPEGEGRVAFNRIDTTVYADGEKIKTYHGPEFRLSGRYALNESTSLKAGYNRSRQNVHLLLNAASISPTDIWRLSNSHIAPQIADQVSAGIYKNYYGKHVLETSAEVYYKGIQNLLDFKVGADLQFNKAVETEILQGPGRSYGLELSIKKSSGWLTGWFNYTYSRSLIQLDGNTPNETINGGEFFPTGYDKPHFINTITNYKFTRRYSLSVNMVFASGVPVTYPVGKWNFRNVENLYYSDRNQFRIPNYFRMDLGFNIEGNHKIKKLAHSFWTISVYNALGRDNIYSIFFTVEEGNVEGFKLTVFPNPIPTITYNFSF